MPSPPAEVDVSVALIEALVQEQFPELVGRVEIVASGWDNVIARLGHDLCVRMPRRLLSAPLVQHEADWLPQLAPLLSIDVPAAVAVGEPGQGFPWTWLVCPWFEGRPLTNVAVRDRSRVAAQLGEFVTALHRPSPAGAPVSQWRGIPLADLQPTVFARLKRATPHQAAVLSTAWEQCADVAPWSGPPSWLHGDLHPLNLLTSAGPAPALRAVIDWGDMCGGDPATDLAIAWLAFDKQGRAAFQEAAAVHHPLDDPVWVRARGWAVSLASLFLLDAAPGTALHDVGDHSLRQLEALP